jgi:GNAT superfamily N-acetyltransferase
MSSHVKPDDVEPSRLGVRPPDILRIRPIGIDDWSDVRYVHGNAFRTIVAPHVEPETAAAFLASLGGPGYADHLAASDLAGAWLHGELAGTAGWRRVDDCAPVARIEALFVRPLFTFMGIGSALLAHVESRAQDAGCVAFTATVPPVSVPFLLRFGYDIVGYGADLPDAPFAEPLFFMRKRDDASDRSSDRPGADAAVADDAADLLAGAGVRPRALLLDH